MNKLINTVAIIGGTHGNELTGVYLVKHWLTCLEEVARNSFSTELHLGNPEAIKQNRRYINQDLNRQFNLQDLRSPDLLGWEQQQAKNLNVLLGPKENPRIDFIIDLHTTTANMGVSLLFDSSDPVVIEMAFYIKQQMPQVALFFNPNNRLEGNNLRSMGRLGGLVIEVGPIPQGLLDYQVYSDTREAVLLALDYLEKKNTNQPIDLPKKMPGYQFIEKIRLPENTQGELTAMIHPDLQHDDYKAINPGDPLFITLSGETILYQGSQTVYGAFINEAAYYDKNIGLSFMRKIEIDLATRHHLERNSRCVK